MRSVNTAETAIFKDRIFMKLLLQKIIADIITEASGIACWVYIEKYVHHKSLQEMLGERKDADKFIFAVDTWFKKILGRGEC